MNWFYGRHLRAIARVPPRAVRAQPTVAYLGIGSALRQRLPAGRKGSAFTIRQKPSFWTSNYKIFHNAP